jgi:hypothetical protein
MPAHPLSVGSADTFPRKGERETVSVDIEGAP